MENITKILEDLGVEIPEDKKDALNKKVSENYKTIAEYEKKVAKMDAELERATERAESAENTLKGFEGKDFDAIAKERDEWKVKAENAQKEYEEKENKRVYSEAINEATKDLKFTSQGAKKAFIADLTSANLTLKDGALLGFNDYVAKYKESDADAFVKDEQGNGAKFTEAQNPTPPMADLKEVDLRRAFGLPDAE